MCQIAVPSPCGTSSSRPSRSRFSTTLKTIGVAVVAVGIAATAFLIWKATLPVLVGKSWRADQRISMNGVDHSAWDELVKKYVTVEGRVDYAHWQSSTKDMRRLDDYLNHLSRADRGRQASREARLAYWINAYNAVTVTGILREYPTTSIRNHTGTFGYNMWDHLSLRSGDTAYSLTQIEHEILRKMDEPRIHFAIVCASIGCPRLLNEAYVPSRLNEQLTTNARDFFSHERNLKIDKDDAVVYVSSILKWFGTDFGATTSDQPKAIAPYLPNDEAKHLLTSSKPTVRYLEYDWDLNDQHSAVSVSAK